MITVRKLREFLDSLPSSAVEVRLSDSDYINGLGLEALDINLEPVARIEFTDEIEVGDRFKMLGWDVIITDKTTWPVKQQKKVTAVAWKVNPQGKRIQVQSTYFVSEFRLKFLVDLEIADL